MAKQEIQINSVKLLPGLKGLHIKYLELKEGTTNTYKEEVSRKIKRPIVGTELLLKFDEFEKYITGLCQIVEGKITVTGVTAGHDKFLLSGEIEVMDGDKKTPINTPLIKEDDGYEKYEEVQNIVDDIFKMALYYMQEGAYTASDKDIVLEFNKGKEGFDAEAVKNMSDEELTILSKKHLEKGGCVVLDPREEDMPGGIDFEEAPLKDISAGDEKQEMFETKSNHEFIPPNEGEEGMEVSKVDGVDFDKILEDERKEKEIVEAELKKQKVAEEKKAKAKAQLEELKKAQAKIEASIDEEDDFIPMRKVV